MPAVQQQQPNNNSVPPPSSSSQDLNEITSTTGQFSKPNKKMTKIKNNSEMISVSSAERKAKQSMLTQGEIENALHLSQQEAAERYGCCVSTVKRAFKKYFPGQRWPSTKRRSDIRKHRSSMKRKLQSFVERLDEEFLFARDQLPQVTQQHLMMKDCVLFLPLGGTNNYATNNILQPNSIAMGPFNTPPNPPSLQTNNKGTIENPSSSFVRNSDQHLSLGNPSNSVTQSQQIKNYVNDSSTGNPASMCTVPLPTAADAQQYSCHQQLSHSLKSANRMKIPLEYENLKLKKLLLEKDNHIRSMLQGKKTKEKLSSNGINSEDPSSSISQDFLAQLPPDHSPNSAVQPDSRQIHGLHSASASRVAEMGMDPQFRTTMEHTGASDLIHTQQPRFLGDICKLKGPWRDIPERSQKNRVLLLCDTKFNVVACSYAFLKATQYTVEDMKKGFCLSTVFFSQTNSKLLEQNNQDFIKCKSVQSLQFTDTWFRKDRSMLLLDIAIKKHADLLWLMCVPASNRRNHLLVNATKKIKKAYTAPVVHQDEYRTDSLYLDHMGLLFYMHETLQEGLKKERSEQETSSA